MLYLLKSVFGVDLQVKVLRDADQVGSIVRVYSILEEKGGDHFNRRGKKNRTGKRKKKG